MGEAKRKLCKRMDEHKRAVRMADFNVSAIAEHGWNGVDWNGVTILDQHKDLHPRLALEADHCDFFTPVLCNFPSFTPAFFQIPR